MKKSLPFWTAKTTAKILLLCGTRSSHKPCSQCALHCGLYYSSHNSRSGVCPDFSYPGNWTAPGVQTFVVQSLGADSACRTAVRIIQCWNEPCLPERIAPAQLHQWQICLQIRGGLQTRMTSIRGAASFQNMSFVLAGTSVACASCTLHINTPSDSISFFHHDKCRYMWLWLSNHMVEPVFSVFSPSPCCFFNPHWTMLPSQQSAFQDALLPGAMAAVM